jgi:hypothetical protein
LLRWASVVDDVPRTAARGRDRIVILDRPAGSTPERAEIIDGTLVVEDADPRFTRAETHEHVGLAAGHPRWLADVLVAESELLLPHPTWSEHELQPAHAALADAVSGPFRGGRDRDDEITPDDFFDPEWTLGDEEPRDGVHALVGIGEISTVVVPDLYSPGPLAPIERIVEPVTLAGPGFQICVDPPTPPDQRVGHPQLLGLMLDPELPSDFKRITGLQQRLVELADLLHSFVVLLDVPPRIGQQAVLRWRTSFASSYAAAYHPWLRVARPDDEREETIRLNPTAVAAGLIARRERLSGVPYGPFNEIAANVVDVVDRLSPARHDELHPLGINVFLRERDGVRLTAGRTLSRDPDYRQLSIRRLMTMLARTLEREAQWMVFEPNNESLQASVKHLLEGFLAQLYEANAFVGASPAEAFFVRCDETLNTQPVLDAGQLIVEIGVAPAEPLEFLVLRLARDGNGTVRVEAPGG